FDWKGLETEIACFGSFVCRPPLTAKAATRRRSRRRSRSAVACPDDRFNLVCLKLYRGEPSYFSIAEATTPASCSFQPAMDCVPGDLLPSSDGRLIQAFDTEAGDFIEPGATVLESIIRCPVCRAERLAASLALVATTLCRLGPVEAVANDGSVFHRPRAMSVGTAETLHGWWTFLPPELMASN